MFKLLIALLFTLFTITNSMPYYMLGPQIPLYSQGIGIGTGGRFDAGPYKVNFGTGVGTGVGVGQHGVGAGVGVGTGVAVRGPGVNFSHGQGIGAGFGQKF